MSRRTRLVPEDQRALADVLAGATTAGRGASSPDGRHARSERSREAMVDALLALLEEGVERPSSAQIAERAGVTQRTLFNQFGDMDSLVSAAAGRQVQRYLGLQPDAGTGTVEERVTRYCDGLGRVLEETMHMQAVLANPGAPSSGARVVRGALHLTRRRLGEAFATELEGIDPTARDEVLDALEIETDPAVWRLRRLHQELTVDECRAVVRRTMLALLRDARGPVGAQVSMSTSLTDRPVPTGPPGRRRPDRPVT
jgi:TetR/AcrR family transcriptional regulator of autoinduction and epiphytic fitness